MLEKKIFSDRPATTAAIEDHQNPSGPKPGAQKIALVGTTYTVDRNVRTPEQVGDALFRKPHANDNRSRDRPRPQHKRVRANLESSVEGTMDPVIADLRVGAEGAEKEVIWFRRNGGRIRRNTHPQRPRCRMFGWY